MEIRFYPQEAVHLIIDRNSDIYPSDDAGRLPGSDGSGVGYDIGVGRVDVGYTSVEGVYVGGGFT